MLARRTTASSMNEPSSATATAPPAAWAAPNRSTDLGGDEEGGEESVDAQPL